MPADHTRNKAPREYRYGSKPTWEIVLDAVLALGRPVSSTEVGDYIVERIPEFALKNLSPDLSVLSVNCNSRGNHGVNSKPRRTDSGNRYDRLVRIGEGRGVRFTEYDPTVHGVWALEDVGKKKLRPRQVALPDSIELEAARVSAASAGVFDPNEDARRRVMAALVQREGQPKFRRALLDEYSGACVITGCNVEALLEAAHIMPYRGAHTNDVTNGLLLRADLHKLFDLHMFRIDPRAHTVHFCAALKASEYGCYEGRRLRQPRSQCNAPAEASLRHHEERCAWMLVESSDE
ncbi:HNH endonuclease [Burkholderia sp. Ac-20384]|uniref:HNH endonuclease n=1 Tax=Burkholderia sp. Ac-20384 TaxID=2703902 RepID=UPI0019811DB1|nr:HNH endonuclease signature motif containing protein [Burkholderia sp. Ac-20384]MBN3826803.1 HNH endonuclease [Burkholderia sp. Ac-20384]